MTNTNTTPDQNKSPVQAPGTENKTPEQLALDKKNEQSKSGHSDNKDNKDNKDTNTEKKA